MMMSGTVIHRPESARGTIGMRIATPTLANAKPMRMISLARRFDCRRPASIAIANMLSDSGASDRPACRALYSRTICRKIGRAIIMPPRATCCIV